MSKTYDFTVVLLRKKWLAAEVGCGGKPPFRVYVAHVELPDNDCVQAVKVAKKQLAAKDLGCLDHLPGLLAGVVDDEDYHTLAVFEGNQYPVLFGWQL